MNDVLPGCIVEDGGHYSRERVVDSDIPALFSEGRVYLTYNHVMIPEHGIFVALGFPGYSLLDCVTWSTHPVPSLTDILT